MKVSSIVKCVRGGSVLEVGAHYRVAVIVEKGFDYHGPTQGLIVIPCNDKDNMRYPYVWDADRFVEVK